MPFSFLIQDYIQIKHLIASVNSGVVLVKFLQKKQSVKLSLEPNFKSYFLWMWNLPKIKL